jgi:hypothetical protein
MSETAPPPTKPPEVSVRAGCKHCAAGHQAEWRAATNEWVHRWSRPEGGAGTRYSITVCVDKTPGSRRE